MASDRSPRPAVAAEPDELLPTAGADGALDPSRLVRRNLQLENESERLRRRVAAEQRANAELARRVDHWKQAHAKESERCAALHRELASLRSQLESARSGEEARAFRARFQRERTRRLRAERELSVALAGGGFVVQESVGDDVEDDEAEAEAEAEEEEEDEEDDEQDRDRQDHHDRPPAPAAVDIRSSITAPLAGLLDGDEGLPTQGRPLFDCFAIVGLPDSALEPDPEPEGAGGGGGGTPQRRWRLSRRKPQAKPEPEPGPEPAAEPPLDAQVLFSFPPDQPLPGEGQLPHFCFPRGVPVRAQPAADESVHRLLFGAGHFQRSARSYVFVLSGADVQYGACVVHDEIVDGRWRVPQCYCLVSRFPFFDLLFNVLWDALAQRRVGVMRLAAQQALPSTDAAAAAAAAAATRQQFRGWLARVLQQLRGVPVPRPGRWCCFRVAPELPLIKYQRTRHPAAADEEPALLRLWALPVLLSAVSADHVLLALGCALTEMDVVVVSENLGLASACVLALAALLAPLQWAGPLVTVLPLSLAEVLEAPVPMLIGMCELPRAFEHREGTLLLFPDRNDVTLHARDSSRYLAAKIPQVEHLCALLQPATERLFSPPDDDRGPLYDPSGAQIAAAEAVATCVRARIAELCDAAVLRAEGTDVSGLVDAAGLPFLDALCGTQMLNVYRGSPVGQVAADLALLRGPEALARRVDESARVARDVVHRAVNHESAPSPRRVGPSSPRARMRLAPPIVVPPSPPCSPPAAGSPRVAVAMAAPEPEPPAVAAPTAAPPSPGSMPLRPRRAKERRRLAEVDESFA